MQPLNVALLTRVWPGLGSWVRQVSQRLCHAPTGMSRGTGGIPVSLPGSGLGWEWVRIVSKLACVMGAAIVPVCLAHSLLSLPGSGLGWEWVRELGKSQSPYSPPLMRPPKKALTRFILKPGPARAVPSNKRSLSVAAYELPK